jgi:CRP-like cAMP-binding protein
MQLAEIVDGRQDERLRGTAMQAWLHSMFGGGAILAHLSYIFLIVAMLMDRVLYLRILAIAAGVAGFLYLWIFLNDRVASIWEVLFILAALFQLLLTAYRNRQARFSEDERFFRDTVVPGLSPSDVRKVLKAATLKDVETGARLTREDEPVEALAFIVAGDVEVTVCGRPVGRCARGQFIGEISVTGGGPATATAIAVGPVRYFAFESDAFRRLVARHRHIGTELELAFRSGLREKLVRANAALAAQPAA